MTPQESRLLQEVLIGVFEAFNVDVAVGITRRGISILAQDERVNAAHIGYPKAYDAS
jgi:hypothetical protein